MGNQRGRAKWSLIAAEPPTSKDWVLPRASVSTWIGFFWRQVGGKGETERGANEEQGSGQ